MTTKTQKTAKTTKATKATKQAEQTTATKTDEWTEHCDKAFIALAAKTGPALAAKPAPKAKASKKAPKAKPAAEAKPEPKPAKASKPAAEPKPRDSRLPAEGTVLTKRTADGRVAECKVGAGNGGTYAGKEYNSLSSAARAAAADLGLNVNQNGFLFWGLIKPSATRDPLAAAEKAIANLRAAFASADEASRRDLADRVAELNAEMTITGN